jgi:hypothetical protein
MSGGAPATERAALIALAGLVPVPRVRADPAGAIDQAAWAGPGVG